ncbi:hypothetical protein N7493_000315 [Penicillium malachiteum]|uniref:Major facilitator superfamily (MFS) profile domain-containing protein n=1 Tax=Penicillium malachiteum TaxID=1324776 RepID=A0AAD6N0L8_9EURO|nr:hypothetical protein N7493_000315 [Penicillium malachiteum]
MDSPYESATDTKMIPEEKRRYLTGMRLYLVTGAVTLVSFLMLLDLSIIVTAIPRITDHFNSLADVGWYGSSYQIASACLQPLTGKVYSNFNSKWTFLGFFFVFELGSLLCGIANSSKMLIIARAVAGMGGSGLMNGGLTIIASLVPLHKSPGLIGMVMGFKVCQLGMVGGPLIGGVLTEKVSWRWCFYINLPVGAIATILLLCIEVPDQMIKPPVKHAATTIMRELDLIGFALFSPAAIQLLLALEYGAGTYGWKSATVIGLFCGAAATFIIFLLWEHRIGNKAMIPLNMVANRKVWTSCVVVMAMYGAGLASSYYLPIYFQAVKDDSPIMSGVSLLPTIVMQIIFAVMSGTLIGRLGYYTPWTIFSGITNSIGAGLLSTFTPHTSTGKWIGYEVIFGASRGAGFQTPIIAIQNAVPQGDVSVAMALLIFSQTLAGAVFLTLANVIFDAGLKSLLKKDAPNADAAAILAAGATSFRTVVSKADLPGVLKAYAKSCDYVFYMATGLGVVIFAFAFGMGWTDVRKKKPSEEKA